MSVASKLLNYVQRDYYQGTSKTRFYTEYAHGLTSTDNVFIIGGNYDTYNLITQDPFATIALGYKILNIPNPCAITLDIDWNAQSVWNQDLIDNYIKVYAASDAHQTSFYQHFNYAKGNTDWDKFNLTNTNIFFNGLSFSKTFGTVSTDITSQFNAGFTPSYSGLTGNGLLYIVDTFNYNNFTFSQGEIYQYNGITWSLDKTSIPAMAAKGNFRSGLFLGGIHNDGIFGSFENTTIWTGVNSTWQNGLLYNAEWLSGEMGSVVKNSNDFYANIIIGSTLNQKLPIINSDITNPNSDKQYIKISTDQTNNNNIGYNQIINSNLNSVQIDSAQSFNSNFGFGTNSNAMDLYFTNIIYGASSSFTGPTGVTILNGIFNNSNFNYSTLVKGNIVNSTVENSWLQGANFINSYGQGVALNTGQVINEGSTKIILVTKQVNVYLGKTVVTFQFTITPSDFYKFTIGDIIYFNGLKTDTQVIDNIFNNPFILGRVTPTEKFGYLYGVDGRLDIITKLLTPAENTSNQFMIELGISLNTDPLGDLNYTTFYNNIVNLVVLQNNVFTTLLDTNNSPSRGLDYSNGTIQIGNFNKSVLNGGVLASGTIINDIDNILLTSTDPVDLDNNSVYNWMASTILYNGATALSINLRVDPNYDTWNNNKFNIGDLVHLNDLYANPGFGTASFDVSGAYLVASYSFMTASRSIILTEYFHNMLDIIPLSYDLFPTHFAPNYSSIYNNGIYDVLFQGGYYQRLYLGTESSVVNVLFDNTDRNFTTANVTLLTFRNFITINNNNIYDGTFYNSIFANCSINGGLFYKTVSSNMNVVNSIFRTSQWNSGTFSGIYLDSRGSFANTAYNPYGINQGFNSTGNYEVFFANVDNFDFYSYSAKEAPSWNNGNFLNGEMYNCVWFSGTFSNGLFHKSFFGNGTWLNGIFGNKNFANEDTQFVKGTWMNGVFNKGIFGSTVRMDGLGNIVASASWYNGQFNGGRFLGAYHDSGLSPLFPNPLVPAAYSANSFWYNGNFNNGSFEGNSKWYNGNFNNGSFMAYYNPTASSMTGSSLDYDGNVFYDGNGQTGPSFSFYAWENGIFNGGVFGTKTLDNTNSRWLSGVFNGGIFQGKVWRNGIFKNGSFYGSGSASQLLFDDTVPPPITYLYNNEEIPYREGQQTMYSESFTQSYYGLWVTGSVINDIQKAIGSFALSTLNQETQNLLDTLSANINANIYVKQQKKKKTTDITFTNVLWQNGTFDSAEGVFQSSMWWSGVFNNGLFTGSLFNPFVRRWNTSETSPSDGLYWQFDLSSNTLWNYGVFDTSEFYISQWNDGNFNSGLFDSGLWQNGIVNYGLFRNAIWNNGMWQNGIWEGAQMSPFDWTVGSIITGGGGLEFLEEGP